jgi:cysteinyl-tRNA synthetase
MGKMVKQSKLMLYNTLTRKKEVFKPIKKGFVNMYTCGPTVYKYAHIGNLRTYVFEDILKRVLVYNGFQVQHIMNITDVGHLTSDEDQGEDKIEMEAKRENKTPQEIANFYTKTFQQDLKNLNIIEPRMWCKATEHISDQISLIKKLEEKGYTYIGKNGNVYFNTAKFKNYGKLARLKLKQKALARIEEDSEKKNPRDFVLWFSLQGSKFKGHLLKWQSPWGEGWPGWHIECSAMSMKYLGEHFDIHCSGIDHIPIHHTNELAQSEAASGKKFVNYWLHSNFLVFGKEKMSKSSGEFITLQNLIEKDYDSLAYRYFCLTAHYRNELLFSWQNLDSSQNAFNSIKNKVLEIKENLNRRGADIKKIKEYKEKFEKVINDDLDMPKALALFWQALRDNKLNNAEKYALILDFDKVFGLNLDKVEKQQVQVPQEIQKLLEEREKARKTKDFRLADKLRDKIKKAGWQVDDTPDGPKLRKI